MKMILCCIYVKENVNIRGYPNQTVFNIQALFYLADLDALVVVFNWIGPLVLYGER